MKTVLNEEEFKLLCKQIASRIHEELGLEAYRVYGIPKGGLPVAYEVSKHLPRGEVVFFAQCANVLVDDLIDSGVTEERYKQKYPSIPFYSLLDKRGNDYWWVEFPWEAEEAPAEDAIIRLLQANNISIESLDLEEVSSHIKTALKRYEV